MEDNQINPHIDPEVDSFMQALKQQKEMLGYVEASKIDAIRESMKINQTAEQALRYNQGKPQWSLVDFDSLEGLVHVLEYGARKYSKDNWKKGMPVTQVSESLMRHLFAFLRGDDIDPESGCRHISHVMCNAMFLEYILREKPHFDDRKNSNNLP